MLSGEHVGRKNQQSSRASHVFGGRDRGFQGEKLTRQRTASVKNKPVSRETSGGTERGIYRKKTVSWKNHTVV